MAFRFITPVSAFRIRKNVIAAFLQCAANLCQIIALLIQVVFSAFFQQPDEVFG